MALVLSVSRNVARRSRRRRINVMRLVHENPTGQPWVKPEHDVFCEGNTHFPLSRTSVVLSRKRRSARLCRVAGRGTQPAAAAQQALGERADLGGTASAEAP